MMKYSFDDQEFTQRESAFAKEHRNDSDEQLLQCVRDRAAELGRNPNKHEMPGFVYIKSRIGAWPVVLERAGLKQVNYKRLARELTGGQKKQQQRQKSAAQQQAAKVKKLEKMLDLGKSHL